MYSFFNFAIIASICFMLIAHNGEFAIVLSIFWATLNIIYWLKEIASNICHWRGPEILNKQMDKHLKERIAPSHIEKPPSFFCSFYQEEKQEECE